MKKVRSHLATSFAMLGIFTLLTGLIYPLAITGLAQAIFPFQANGSLIERAGKLAGSELIGQAFSEPEYFWGRPSATSQYPYNASASSGSNLGPDNPALEQAIQERIAALKSADLGNPLPIPVDLVTASASGLDPHISVAAALYQVPRVARERGLSEELVRQLVEEHIEGRQLGILGEARVNVLQLNLALAGLQ